MTAYLLTLHLIALIGTIAFELLFACICGYRKWQTLRTVALAQVVTNPVVVLLGNLFLFYTAWPMWSFLVPLEIAAVCTEWQIYRRCANAIQRPLRFSFAANVFSYTMGLALQNLGAFDWIKITGWD